MCQCCPAGVEQNDVNILVTEHLLLPISQLLTTEYRTSY